MQEIFAALDDFDPAEHEREARKRWGDTGAWQQSQQRTATYGPEQWVEIRQEAADLVDRLAAVHADGADPASDAAVALAEEHRAHIDRWFYDCPVELHRRLGDVYVADVRFTAYWEGAGEDRAGLAEFVRAAFAANADARSGD